MSITHRFMLLVIVMVMALIPGSDLKSLTKDTFDQMVGKQRNMFVYYFSPKCPHCIQLDPVWTRLTRAVNTADTGTVVARVDCTKQVDLCDKQSIKGTPTLLMYPKGEKGGIEYEGPRDYDSLIDLLKKQFKVDPAEVEDTPLLEFDWSVDESDESPELTNGLYELNDDNFDKFLSSGRHFVMFYAPWCGHCQILEPTWTQLAGAFQFETQVKISRINCDLNRDCCNKFNIKGYPTILWIVDGKVVEKYASGRTIADLTQFVVDHVDDDAKVNVRTGDLVPQLVSTTFKDTISRGYTFVQFKAPWCSFCKGMTHKWDSLARMLVGTEDIKIAFVDCSVSIRLCEDEKINGFPTLNLYKDGVIIKEYEGERETQSMYQFVTTTDRESPIRTAINKDGSIKQEL